MVEPMTEDEIRKFIQECYAAYARGERAFVLDLFDDHVDWIIYAPGNVLPLRGRRRGRVEVLQTLAEIDAVYRLVRHDIEILVVEGDRAAIMTDTTVVQRSTRRTIKFKEAGFYRYRDRRILEYRGFVDSFDLVEQVLGRFLPTT